jgi:hypothetical protein
MAEHTPDSFKILLEKLVKTPEYFIPGDLKLALHHLFTPNAALPAQIGAFLAALHIGRVAHYHPIQYPQSNKQPNSPSYACVTDLVLYQTFADHHKLFIDLDERMLALRIKLISQPHLHMSLKSRCTSREHIFSSSMVLVLKVEGGIF